MTDEYGFEIFDEDIPAWAEYQKITDDIAQTESKKKTKAKSKSISKSEIETDHEETKVTLFEHQIKALQ